MGIIIPSKVWEKEYLHNVLPWLANQLLCLNWNSSWTNSDPLGSGTQPRCIHGFESGALRSPLPHVPFCLPVISYGQYYTNNLDLGFFWKKKKNCITYSKTAKNLQPMEMCASFLSIGCSQQREGALLLLPDIAGEIWFHHRNESLFQKNIYVYKKKKKINFSSLQALHKDHLVADNC